MKPKYSRTVIRLQGKIKKIVIANEAFKNVAQLKVGR
jgi:hypothetical protein